MKQNVGSARLNPEPVVGKIPVQETGRGTGRLPTPLRIQEDLMEIIHPDLKPVKIV